MKRVTLCLAVAILLTFAGSAFAIPVQWNSGTNHNHHWYEAIAGSMSWTSAKNAVAASTYSGMQGYLATITFSEENAHIWGLSGDQYAYLLGGYQTITNQGAGSNWAWVTGEPWTYTHWYTTGSEPNDYQGNPEHTLELWTNGYWNDNTDSNSYYSGANHLGYIVEYDASRTVIPEPATMSMLGLGLFGLLGLKKKTSR